MFDSSEVDEQDEEDESEEVKEDRPGEVIESSEDDGF